MSNFGNLSAKEIWTKFLLDLKQAFTAPAADPLLTLMVTLIIFIVLTAVVLLFVVIYMFFTRGRRVLVYTKVQVSQRDIWLSRLFFLVFAIVLAATANYYAERTQSCLNCHPAQLTQATLDRTAHKGIECIGCHRGPGVVGYFQQKLDIARMAVVYLQTRDPKKTLLAQGGFVTNAACLKCHSAILERVVIKGNLAMSHDEPEKENRSCLECHSPVAHPGQGPQRTFSMSSCMACHTYMRASVACKTCHPKNAEGYRAVNIEDLPKVDLPSELRCYEGCHDEKKECLPCHQVTMPHPEDWVASPIPAHIRYAAFTKKKLCWQCHYDGDRYFEQTKTFCQRCHPLQFHGPDEQVYWSHQRFTTGECTGLCHRLEFCDQACHTRKTPRSPLPARVQNSEFGYPRDLDF